MAVKYPLPVHTFLVSQRFPPELILAAIERLPYEDGKVIAHLRATHPRFRDILHTYDRSLAKNFVRRELRHASTDFPCTGETGLTLLAECARKYDTVDDIMDALASKQNCCALRRYNISAVNTGLLLLYRLSSIRSHGARLAYIKSLSCDPLTAMYLAINHATLSARFHSTGWISQRTYGRFMDSNQLSLRTEMEFCFAEAALNIGPEFISNMLLHHSTSGVETVLLNFYHNHADHDWDWPCWGTHPGEFEPPRTQGPHVEPITKERSLFTTMLERIAELIGCELDQVRTRIERYTSVEDHALAYLGLEGKAILMQGHDLEDVEGNVGL